MHAAPGKNHFELFGLPVSFDVDTGDLTSRYRELQRRVHPDRFASAPEQERRLSLQMTARVNEAFQTLKNPVRRGRYLLSLRGVDMDGETDTAMDPAFLMEQMEWREHLEAIRDAEQPQQRLADLADLADRIEQQWQEKLGQLRQALTGETPEQLSRARNLVREMQFLEKLRQETINLEEEMS